MNHLPPLPPSYNYALAKRQNLLLGYHRELPILYLEEETMTWRELDRHVSEVHHALASST